MPFTLDAFYSPEDARRVRRVLRKLAEHQMDRWALTGGLAIEVHLVSAGSEPSIRQLNDIDFIAPWFEAIAPSLGRELLFRHVHPSDPPGKTLLQAIDPETKVRIDVFHAYGSEMERAVPVEIEGLALRMVSLPDLVARHTRLNWDLIEGQALAPKYARDLLRLLESSSGSEVGKVWPEHRKSKMPESFEAACERVREAIRKRPDLLVHPAYSTKVGEICDRCKVVNDFPLADAGHILSILGYC
jgi:hypothetical protein